ncbi:trafficking protein particle complex subunit 2-like protein [Agrilus planipennis]|uniref:Trafficking protein particle complex subunit 2-like protein n=1 Tax=Agrilus planipennis TaxID=224129 RepID=A0A7F5RBR3_AGRPL|nr:trafficking protein particle complex subunit 2-like protein [Agrilus planipennis]
MAVCAAIVGKDNSPKYFACTNPDEELNFQYKVLSSLDVVEEKLNAANKGSDMRELYLGILYSLETHKIYGYVTNTKIKFIIVAESTNTALRDNEIRSMFRKLHSLRA